jgi:serine/threonine protein kinase
VQRGSISFAGHHWDRVSNEGKDFVSRLLTVGEEKRLSASEALNHPWIRGRADSAWSALRPDEFTATASALSNIMKFSAKSKLKQATYALIASQLLAK